MPSRNRLRKLLGLSAVLGVAATGVLIARRERTVAPVSPGRIHDHLHARHREAQAAQREAAAGTWGSE